jgi:hypothetical protein
MEEKKFKSGTEYHLQKLFNYYKQPIVLDKDNRTSGAYAWSIMFIAIILYDVYAIKTKKAETLTRFFWRQTEKPIHGLLPVFLWFAITAHLILEKKVRKKILTTKK